MTPTLKHEHTKDCPYNAAAYLHYLVEAAPDFLWFDVQDVGDYQGTVYGVATYQGRIWLYENGYGSCSGCGAWGEGGEPANQADVIAQSKSFDTVEEAIAVKVESLWNEPDRERRAAAIREAGDFLKRIGAMA